MPLKQNILLKYKCSELCCGKIIREDKWLEYCKKFHAFKTNRDYEIKRETIEYKVAGEKWLIYRFESENHPTATAASVAVAEAPEPHPCSASSDEVGNFRKNYYSLSCRW